ncbi:unnamed protein product, partial [Rhizoctonia solani]
LGGVSLALSIKTPREEPEVGITHPLLELQVLRLPAQHLNPSTRRSMPTLLHYISGGRRPLSSQTTPATFKTITPTLRPTMGS